MSIQFSDNPVLGKFTGDTYERQLDAVREAIADPVLSAEEQIERRCDAIVRDLDELCKFATNPETVDLIEGQKHAVGQMMVRVQLILSFLLARKSPKLTVISNG